MSSAHKFNNKPVLIISMGVSGCGKSTLAALLAQQFGYTFLEADDFHSAENKAHMAAGKPLTDAMREPWINLMCHAIRDRLEAGESCVLAYSGLRKAHRQRFRELGHPVKFLHLAGEQSLIRQRMEARTNHFMPTGLLESQYQALESTDQEADVSSIRIDQPVPILVEQANSLVATFVAANG